MVISAKVSETEKFDADRRAFLKQFAVGAVAVPIMVSSGVFRIPDIAGWGNGNAYAFAYGYGHGHGYAYGYGHGPGPVF